jgi:hypothetical protein
MLDSPEVPPDARDEAQDPVYARKEDVILRDVAGERLLVPIRNSVADLQAIFALGGIGAFIWERLDGERTLGAVLAGILESYQTTSEDAWADLQAFVERLRSAGLIERRR